MQFLKEGFVMLKMEMYMTIITLWKQGLSVRAISRATKSDRRTIKKIIDKYQQDGNIEVPMMVKPTTTLEPYKEQIIDYLERNLSGVRIFEELQGVGMSSSYSAVIRYIKKLKGKNDICVRFHALPGEEAQIDFGYVGLMPIPGEDGRRKKAWVFNMRLSYSRLDYYEVVFDQKVETFINCHINAFRYFGGVAKTIKIDNLKAAILEANFYEPTYQQIYKQFAEAYGCMVVPCRVRSPQEKGKVESGIKYVSNNFFAGRKFESFEGLCSELQYWVNNKCNMRVHGTTRKIPRELFEMEEKSHLIRLPMNDFIFPEIIRRKVYRDCHIMVYYNYYSVPYEYVGKTVDVQRDSRLVYIICDGKQIAVHPRSDAKGVFITNESHYPKYKHFTPKSEFYRSECAKKMEFIGQSASMLFGMILEKEPYNWYRTVSGILNLQKFYSKEVVELSCKRALSFGIIGYKKIKNICKTGSYNLPLDRSICIDTMSKDTSASIVASNAICGDTLLGNIIVDHEVANG